MSHQAVPDVGKVPGLCAVQHDACLHFGGVADYASGADYTLAPEISALAHLGVRPYYRGAFHQSAGFHDGPRTDENRFVPQHAPLPQHSRLTRFLAADAHAELAFGDISANNLETAVQRSLPATLRPSSAAGA